MGKMRQTKHTPDKTGLSRGEYVPTGTLRDNDIVGAIADAIAKNVGKLQPQVVRKDEKGMTIKNDYLARILTLRPCPEMSTYDFLYRIAADLVYTCLLYTSRCV